MKTKQRNLCGSPRLALLALLLAIVSFFALAPIVRAAEPVALVTVGNSYVISSGTAAFTCRVVADLGGGWFKIKTNDGRELSVNVARAFFIQEIKTK